MKRFGSVITDPEAHKLSNPDPKHYCTKLIVKNFKKVSFDRDTIMLALHLLFWTENKI
jgi:hypothetical protein